MKRHFFSILKVAAVAAATAALGGCTGDPNQGGIFWDESKAQQRIADREAHLRTLDADTQRLEAENARMQRKAD